MASSYRPSRKGQVPFHPVSLFVAICLRLEERKSWRGLAKLLAGEQGPGWRTLCGFREGDIPSASGPRYFFHVVGPQVFEELCPQLITLLQQHGLCPERNTYPGDPEDRGVSLTLDGQLHPARSRPSCQLATDSCYKPLPQLQEPALPTLPQSSSQVAKSEQSGQEEVVAAPAILASEMAATPTQSPAPPSPTPPRRPCRAAEHGREGCACDTPECQERCRRASVLDPQARFIHHEGHNDKHSKAKDAGRSDKPRLGQGVNVFGYLSEA